MKKTTVLTLTMILAVLMLFLLAACDNDAIDHTDIPENEHDEDVSIAESGVDNQQEYLAALDNFRNLMSVVAVDAESLSNLVRRVWEDAARGDFDLDTMMFIVNLRDYDWNELWEPGVGPIYPFTDNTRDVSVFIFMNQHRGRNNYSTALSLMDNNKTIIEKRANIDSGRSDVSAKYWQLGRAPEGLERAESIASAMFESFDVLVALANNPTGSLSSFTENQRSAADEFTRNYRLLGDIINTFGEN